MTIAISYPYTIDPNSGQVADTNNSSKIYLDQVVTLLSTNVNQRPMTPTYGVDWSTAIFENEGISQAAISQAISAAIGMWIPAVSVANISFSDGGSSGTETVNLTLNLPDNTVANLSVNSNTLNYSGTIVG
jgi:phage baseplate assembly protein W